MPVVPATQEAEAREPLEPGGGVCSEQRFTPLHSSLGHRVRLHLKIKIKKEIKLGIGVVAHAYNPSTFGGQGGQIT